MPTAAEYRSIASGLGSARDDLAGSLRPVADGATAEVLAGPERIPLELAVEVSARNLSTVLAGLQVQIDEAHRRAGVCDGYAAAMRRYRQSDDPNAAPPPRPAWWVSDG